MKRCAASAALVWEWVRARAEAIRVRGTRSGGPEDAATPRAASRRPRRRVTLVAAGAAIAVLLTGLLWPSGATSEVADGVEETVRASPAEERTPSIPPTPDPAAPVSAGRADDPAAAASRLLDEIDTCADAGDSLCAHAVADGSSDVIAALSGDAAASSAAVALVDEYGDAAVLRLTPTETGEADAAHHAGSGERILVLVRINEKWLVRDVYDVADQPE